MSKNLKDYLLQKRIEQNRNIEQNKQNESYIPDIKLDYDFIFIDENKNVISHLKTEITEQVQAQRYIQKDSIVLELGARYGTVSCMINKKIDNPLNQVSVEPDKRVQKALEENMIKNNCNFHIINSFISKIPLELTELESGYGTTSIPVENSIIQSYTLSEVENKYNLKFNTLVADCEGFLEQFFDENPQLYGQLSLVMFEKDYANKCNYNKIIDNLKINNFICLEDGFHSVWRKNMIYI
jgi:FkbM family methyltransferase